MTSVFGARPRGYRWGFMLLLLSCICYVIGFSSPYWSEVTLSKYYLSLQYSGWVHIREHVGLWEVCYSIYGTEAKECVSTSQVPAPGWFSSVKGLQAVCLLCQLAACMYAIVINWVQRHPRFSRLLEITSALGGLAGCIGIVIYVNNATDDTMKSILIYSTNAQVDSNHVGWAFWVAAAGAGMCMISSILIAIFNRYPLSVPNGEPTGPTFDPDTGMPLDPSVLTNFDIGSDGEVYYIPTQAMAAGFCPPPYDSLGVSKDGFPKPPPYEASAPPADGAQGQAVSATSPAPVVQDLSAASQIPALIAASTFTPSCMQPPVLFTVPVATCAREFSLPGGGQMLIDHNVTIPKQELFTEGTPPQAPALAPDETAYICESAWAGKTTVHSASGCSQEGADGPEQGPDLDCLDMSPDQIQDAILSILDAALAGEDDEPDEVTDADQLSTPSEESRTS